MGWKDPLTFNRKDEVFKSKFQQLSESYVDNFCEEKIALFRQVTTTLIKNAINIANPALM